MLSSEIDHPLFPGFATRPLTGAAQGSSVGVTGHRIDSVRNHQSSIREKCSGSRVIIAFFGGSFRKVPGLLHGGNDQNLLGVPDRNQIVRGISKNRAQSSVRNAQFKKLDAGVDPAPCLEI